MTDDKLGLHAEFDHVRVPPLQMGAILRRGNSLLRRRRMIAAVSSGAIISLVIAGGVAVLDAANQPSQTPVQPAGEAPTEAPASVTVFLVDGLAPEGLRHYVNKFAEIGGISSFEFVSKREAFKMFKERYEDQPEYWENLPKDALPAYFIVVLSDPHEVSRVVERLEGLPGVDDVQVGAGADFDEGTADAYRLVTEEGSTRVYAPRGGQPFGLCPQNAQKLAADDLSAAEAAVLLAKDEITGSGLNTEDAHTDSGLAIDHSGPPDFSRIITRTCEPSLVERTALVALRLPNVDSASMSAETYFISREPRGWVIWYMW